MPDDNRIIMREKSIIAIPEFTGDSGVMRVTMSARVIPVAAIFIITDTALLQ